jgi:myo-inositol-1(or 4)-monophosphatase
VTGEPANLTRELATLAGDLARDAGRVVVEMRSSVVGSATTKSSPTDPVTEADKAAEAIVVGGIERARPDDGIVGEEGTDRSGTSGLVWYIDPIDGTTNYLYDIPAYSVSIAVGEQGGPIRCGAVYNPVADELFEATAGGGATLNGRPIGVAAQTDLAAALVATGFGYRAERRRAQAAVVAELLPTVRDIRRMGSAALDLCWVACGRFDAYYEGGLNRLDFAAGWLIAAEAGAVCDDLRGGPPSTGFLVASAPGVHRQLGDRLRDLAADDLPS